MKYSLLSLTATVFALLLCGTSCSESDRTQVRLATLFNDEHHLGKKLHWTAQELEKRSDGRFECHVFTGSTMGGEKENLEDLLLGNLEVMNGGGSYLWRYVPEGTVLELPLYGWQDRQEARRVIKAYWPQFTEALNSKGFHPIALDSRDYWGVYYREPIDSLDAVKNAKFRAVNADLWIEITKLYGAVPNPMPYADAYMAFKTGVSDGTTNSVAGGVGGNWHEVLKCFLDTRLVLSEGFTVTSKPWLDNLPEDLREIFLQVGIDSEDYNMEEVQRQYEVNRQKMRDAGVHFVNHEDLDLSNLQAQGMAFRDEFMKKQGPEAYQFFLDWLEHVEKETGRPQRQDASLEAL